MKKALFPLCLLLTLTCGCGPSPQFSLERSGALTTYPSGSAIAYLDHRLCLMGDDANYLYIGDTALRQLDSIPLYFYPEQRIPKALKADLEAATVVTHAAAPALLLLGSGSQDTQRSNGWLIFPGAGAKRELRLAPFYDRIKAAGVRELNIEAAAAVRDEFVLASRGHKGYPKNQLVVTSSRFWDDPAGAPVRLIAVEQDSDTASFSGISGADYSSASDRLFLTLSTEDTRSTHADGAIGKSYLWIIDRFSERLRQPAVRPDRIIDLAAGDKRFAGHKVESVCVLSEEEEGATLMLVADDDRGTTLWFRIRVGGR